MLLHTSIFYELLRENILHMTLPQNGHILAKWETNLDILQDFVGMQPTWESTILLWFAYMEKRWLDIGFMVYMKILFRMLRSMKFATTTLLFLSDWILFCKDRLRKRICEYLKKAKMRRKSWRKLEQILVNFFISEEIILIWQTLNPLTFQFSSCSQMANFLSTTHQKLSPFLWKKKRAKVNNEMSSGELTAKTLL